MEASLEKIKAQLFFLYNNAEIFDDLVEIIEKHKQNYHHEAVLPKERLSEKDAVLITYGDQISGKGGIALDRLHNFVNKYLKGKISTIHFLPFYPYSSDDGFSVIDYLSVNPNLGSWDDVEKFGKDFKLMFDAVINHISVSSIWFKGFLENKEPYKDYFISLTKDTNLSSITRPRTTPLLTKFETSEGEKFVWTTFSADQVDLNYANPQVLLDIIKVLLFYISKGAEIIRLDAITYLWKEIGTSGVHHPKTHAVLRLLRTVLEIVAPRTVLISETNVPHRENISYFGNGYDEAQMVYNFALPPLTLYSFLKQDASKLAEWARGLKTPSDETNFFNFLASHDGIGLRPVEDIIGNNGIEFLVAAAEEHGGFVSYKENSDGSKSPYELNINYFDALNNEDEDLETQTKRFVCAHSIMFALAGVPGIYVHSIFGSLGNPNAVKETGLNRQVNREKFEWSEIEEELSDNSSRRARVLSKLGELLEIRKKHKAFHPQAGQEILPSQTEVLAIRRFSDNENIYCLHNLSLRTQEFKINSGGLIDLRTGKIFQSEIVSLEPLAALWLKEQN